LPPGSSTAYLPPSSKWRELGLEIYPVILAPNCDGGRQRLNIWPHLPPLYTEKWVPRSTVTQTSWTVYILYQ